MKTQSGWGFGQAVSPIEGVFAGEVEAACLGYEGWMRLDGLAQSGAGATHYIHSLKAPVFTSADIKSPILRLLPLNALLRADQLTGAFLRLEGEGFVHVNHSAPLGEYKQTDFVAQAQAHIGLPYIWAGVSTDGLDCSGLIQSSLRACGRDCLRDASQQETSLGTPLSDKAELKRGDLIFWAGHVGVMSTPETLLHANAYHMRVEAEPLSAAIARVGVPRSIRRLEAYNRA